MLHTLAGYFSTTKAQKMCKSPKYPSIINHKKPFYVNVNGEKDEISKSAKNKEQSHQKK